MQKLSQLVAYLQRNFWYSIFIIILALVSLLLFVSDLIFIFEDITEPEWVVFIRRIDIVVAWIFLTDFFMGLFFNKELTTREYWRLNWLNLISSVPVTNQLTLLLRGFRILRAVRVARAGTNLYFARKRHRHNWKNDYYK